MPDPISFGVIYNKHSIDYNVPYLQGTRGFFERTWDVITQAMTPPASLR